VGDEDALDAYRQAVRMLGRRALTSGELLHRLAEKGFDAVAAEQAVEKARDRGFLDDDAIARRMAERLILEKAYGRRRADDDMRRRRLDPVTARRALDELEEHHPEAEEEALRRSSDRWISRHGKPRDRPSRSRLAGHLKGRGFPDHLIRREVLDRHGRD